MKGLIVHRCGWCGQWAHPARGVILERIAGGRFMCEGCGRFTLHCTCPRHG